MVLGTPILSIKDYLISRPRIQSFLIERSKIFKVSFSISYL